MGSRTIMEFEDNAVRLLTKPVGDDLGRMVHAALGVAGEAGELIDAIKKTWIYGKPLDKANVVEECGDAMFYIAVILHLVGSDIASAMRQNIAKLEKRYPQGYTDKAAIERADKQ